jgi:peptide/nickel transport system substrate-binding protein
MEEISAPSVRGMNRRAFIERLASMGFSTAVIGRLLAAGAPAAFLAACSDDDSSATTDASDPAGSPSTAAATTGSVGGGGALGTLIIGNAEPHTSVLWDPHAQFGLADIQFQSLVFETLLYYDEQAVLTEGIASRWFRTDPTTLRMELNSGITFHDGSPLTPEDIKASLERVSDPDSGLVYSGYFTPGVEVTIVDEKTIDVTTPEPFGPLETVLTMIPIAPAKDLANPDVYKTTATGSGPYKFVRFEQDRTVLEANSEYWRGAPANAGVELVYIADTQARQNALLTGEIDIHTRSSSFTLDAIDGDESYTLSTVGPASQFIYIPQHTDELADVRVRQALAHAIDRDAIAQNIVKINPKATSSISASASGYKAGTPPFEYDPARARELLAEAGVDSGFSIEMASSNLIAHQPDIDQLVKSQLEEIGITVNITTLETGTFRSTYPDYGLSFNSLGTFTPDPHSILSFYTEPITEFAMSFVDPKITELLTQTKSTTGDDRQASIDAMTQYLWENQIMLYITDDNFHTLAGPTVTGYQRNGGFGEYLVWKAAKAS